MHAKLGRFLIIAVIGGSGLGLWRQSELRARLRRELGPLREEHDAMERVREENRTLTMGQPSATELARLRDSQGTTAELRAEIARLQAKTRTAEEKLAAVSVERFVPGAKVSTTEWRNAGSDTWMATLETVLWAAAGGDLDAFAGNLLLSNRTKSQAIALLEKLPSALRQQLGTPEKLVAFFATKDVPLGTAELIDQVEFQARTGPTVHAFVKMTDPDGNTKDLRLRLTKAGNQWKLVVPEGVAEKCSALMKSPSAAFGPR